LSEGINTQSVLAMRSSGYYSERTAGARDVINNVCKMVIEALAQTPKSSKLRIADYGAADGGTSREMWDMVINVQMGIIGRLKCSILIWRAMIFQLYFG
jgi:hypothetical protein